MVYGWPILYALFVWWFSTGVIIWLDLRPRTFRWSIALGTIILVVCLWRLHKGRADTSLAGAYAAFTYAVLAWGWQEMSFFMGYVTGPRRTGSPASVGEWRRFGHGIMACLHHEFAIIATAAIIAGTTWGAPNQVGLWTFLLIWGMRQSAKLNFFLGVWNLGEEFIPPRLAYLGSYIRKRRMNALFPFSVAIGTGGVAWLIDMLQAPGLSEARIAGLTFLATMLTLAVIEHWVLILPIPFTKLWGWALAWRRPATARVTTKGRYA